jgi:hypothetical protein
MGGLAACLFLWLQFRYASQLAGASGTAASSPRPARVRRGSNASVEALLDRSVSTARLLALLGLNGSDCAVETLPRDWSDVDDVADADEADTTASEPAVVPPSNRLIFAVHPGASGGGFLAQLLGTASERNRALHIPTALAMGGEELMAATAARPLRESLSQRLAKADRIEQAFANYLQPNGVYIETNPNFILTFFDVVLERFVARGWRVDIVVLHRHFGRTLKSLVERGYFTRNAATPAEILSPFAADRAVEPPLPAAEMDEYDQLIAFMMDVYARGERLARALQATPNVRIVPLRFETLLSLGGAKAAFRALNLTWSTRSEQFVLASPIVDAHVDLVARLQIDTTLEYCDQRIDRYVARCGAACPDVSAYRGDVAMRAAQTLEPFLDTFTSIELAADDLRSGVVAVRFADARLHAAFRERLDSPALPAFAELPQSARAAARDAPTVVCVQFCFATATSVAAAQVRRLRNAGSLCDKVAAFAIGGGVGDDELRWPADVVARVTVPRLNRERDANIALSLARFLDATHVLLIERDAVLAPPCLSDAALRRQLTSLMPGDAVRLGGGLVLALAIADDQFVGFDERAPPLPFADAPLSVTAREHELDDACQIGRLEDGEQRARWQLAWLRLFATAHRVELTESAVREIVTPGQRSRTATLDAGALSMAREYATLQCEVALRAQFARRWVAQITAQQAWFCVSDAQVAEWNAVFNASTIDT